MCFLAISEVSKFDDSILWRVQEAYGSIPPCANVLGGCFMGFAVWKEETQRFFPPYSIALFQLGCFALRLPQAIMCLGDLHALHALGEYCPCLRAALGLALRVISPGFMGSTRV